MKCLAAAVAALALGAAAGAQQVEGSFDRTLNVSGPVELDIETDSGGIVVKPGAAGSVQVHGILKARRGGWNGSGDVEARLRSLEKNPPISQTGNSIRLGHVTDKGLLRGISIRFEILTPADSRVRARADSGGIRVAGIKGPVDCRTDSGGIEAEDIGSEVHAEVDSGGVHIRNVQGRVFARADSGGIEANGIAGSIDVATDSGGIRLSQTTPATVLARADSGGATLRLAPSGGYDINVSSDSGRITVPEMTVRGSISRQHVEGKVRGGGPLVDIKVDSGHIHIE